jgi:hypothetical protein
MKTLYEHITSELLLEKFLTVLPSTSKDEQLKYAKEVWPMIDDAYRYIGGLAGIKTYDKFVDEFINNPDDEFIWKLVKRGSDITAVVIYKMKNGGRKSVALACLPTPRGGNDLNMILSEDMRLKERGAWAEVSGKALGKFLNMGAMIIPNSVANVLLPNKEIQPLEDGYFYKRFIKGEPHVKMIVGFPSSDIEGEKPTDEMIKSLKELGKKYESNL